MICALWRKSALSLPTIVILAQLRQALSQSTLACPSHLLSPAGTCLSASPGALGGTSRSSGDTVPSTRASILATTGSSASSAAAAATSSSARAAKSGQKMDWEKAAKMSWAAPYVMDLKPGPPDLAPGAPLPVLFVSHGSPMSAVQDTPVSSFWKLLGEKVRQLPGLKSVLIISAHWETAHGVRVNTIERPPTIHDFYGFPEELYKLQYAAKGSESLSKRAMELLREAQIPVAADDKHGLDHGAWVPLRWMFPDAALPVVQLSLLSNGDGAAHVRIGQALSKLREEGVLIIGSGSSTHNLRDLRLYLGTSKIAPYTEPFEDKLDAIVTSKDTTSRIERLIEFEADPLFVKAHPSPEHFYPLNVALGAAGQDTARSIFSMPELSIGYTTFSFGAGI